MGQPYLSVVRMWGNEQLCQLFEYEIELRTPDVVDRDAGFDTEVDLREMNGRELTARIGLPDPGTAPREISGIVTRARYLRAEYRHLVYGVTLRPWLWIASQNRNSRIFEGKTDIEIIEEVLSAYSFPVERRLDPARYPRRIYRTQCDESDFTFVARLMEHWGIAWFFEHSAGTHRLVMTDTAGAYRRPPCATYHRLGLAASDAPAKHEHLDAFSVVDTVVAGKYTTGAYSFAQPLADLTVSNAAPRDTGMNTGALCQEVYAYPSEHAQPTTGNAQWDEGERIARIRMEAIRSQGLRCFGAGRVRALIPGCTFEVIGHPHAPANREYLILGASLTLEQAGNISGDALQWRCHAEVECHPTDEMFRPERITPWPVVTGPQSATVVGPEGHVTHTDEFGRVRVAFPWDRFRRMSCWMRVATPWAGANHGQIGIPRIGTEVLVAFQDGGDPDKPIVVGAVANGMNMPPWQLPGQLALSGIRTREHDGARSNHLVFDDTVGKIQAQLSSDHLASRISMGYVTATPDQAGRQSYRGEGLEARTDGHASLRAALGLLITTHRREAATGAMMSVEDVIALMQEALTLADSLARSATHGQAQTGEQQQIVDALQRQSDEVQGDGELSQFREPHIAIASRSGIVASASGSTHLAGGEHVALTSGRHLSFSAGGGMYASITDRLSVFVQRDGVRLFSAKGQIDVQAQSDALSLSAQQSMRMMSTADWVEISGKKGIRLNVGGNEIRITPDGIETFCGGKWVVHANGAELTGPKVSDYAMPTNKLCAHLAAGASSRGAGAVSLG